jgi:hypothetical protein
VPWRALCPRCRVWTRLAQTDAQPNGDLGFEPRPRGRIFVRFPPRTSWQVLEDFRPTGDLAIDQLLADLTSGPLAHLPSGKFTANAAWLALAGIAHNLLRAAAGCLASARHARARGITIRAELIDVAARIARHGRGRPAASGVGRRVPAGWHHPDGHLHLIGPRPRQAPGRDRAAGTPGSADRCYPCLRCR